MKKGLTLEEQQRIVEAMYHEDGTPIVRKQLAAVRNKEAWATNYLELQNGTKYIVPEKLPSLKQAKLEAAKDKAAWNHGQVDSGMLN